MRLVKMVSAFALAVIVVSMTACGGGGTSISSSTMVSSSTVESGNVVDSSSSIAATSESVSSESVSASTEDVLLYDGDLVDLFGMTEDEVVAVLGEPDEVVDTGANYYTLNYIDSIGIEVKMSPTVDASASVQCYVATINVWTRAKTVFKVPILGIYLNDTLEEAREKLENMGGEVRHEVESNIAYEVTYNGICYFFNIQPSWEPDKIAFLSVSKGF